jgi:succinate-semialdehyde dehydrogenase/glutarate-semialdehyde dehydrogenase
VAQDADIMTAVKGAAAAKFRNAGQVCIAPTRFLVHNSIKAEFNAAVLAFMAKLKVGDGMDATSTMGPLANPRRVTAMQDLTANAVKSGAKLLTGGERIGTVGNFFAPTLLDDVPLAADIFNNEPFGPVVSVRGFDALEDAIAEANRLPFGLAGYAYTLSLKSAHLLARELQVGMLWMNQAAVAWPELPFGGVKDSGYGSEGGPEALEAYVNTRMVSTVC